MKHINIAELLRDCPEGMELDCTIWDNVTLVHVDNEDIPFPITLSRTKDGSESYFVTTKYGQYYSDSKCVIFPKGKTTWEGFHRPFKFKDGDILVHTQNQRFVMSIYHKGITERTIKTHCILWDKNEGLSANMNICCYPGNTRLATEEEKQKLFDALKDNGYKWNPETKTLEKLVEPKFKDGDILTYIYFNKPVIYIYRKNGSCNTSYYAGYSFTNERFYKETSGGLSGNRTDLRLATEEEKQKLFDAINANGYKWNAETKTLEKLIEPKFHKGDWIVNKIGDSWHIDSFDKRNYQVSDGNGNYNYFPISKQDEMRLWTIEDAKDGDVLAFKDGTSGILLYKENTENFGVLSYCRTIRNSFINKEESGWGLALLSPATKEQRDTLFAKMKETGYKWNPETKTLEKSIDEPKFKIEKGKWYVCIKDLLDDYANKAFWKGDIYLSTQDGSLIPSNSNIPYKVEYCTDTYFRDWAIEDAKDGDILYIRAAFEWVCIYKENKDIKNIYKYAAIIISQDSTNIVVCDKISLLCKKDIIEIRPANEEEKQKLFQAIKNNGCKWNSNTKTLEKLITPKFKVGDRIAKKNGICVPMLITNVDDKAYYSNEVNSVKILSISEQDEYELVLDKFDINTLVPFESRVLVRAADNQFWRPAIWGVKQKDWDFYCVVGGEMWEQCIPYEGNEHLRGIADDCDEYYKTWPI